MPRVPPDFLSCTVDHYLHVVDRAQKATVARRVAAVVKRCNDRDFSLPRLVLHHINDAASHCISLVQHMFLPSPTTAVCSAPQALFEPNSLTNTIAFFGALERCKVPARLRIEEVQPFLPATWREFTARSCGLPATAISIAGDNPLIIRARYGQIVAYYDRMPEDDRQQVVGPTLTIVEDLNLRMYATCRRRDKHLHWQGSIPPDRYPDNVDPYAIKVLRRLQCG